MLALRLLSASTEVNGIYYAICEELTEGIFPLLVNCACHTTFSSTGEAMPRKKVIEPVYPSNSSRPADIFRALQTLQEWATSLTGFFNDYAHSAGWDESMRLNSRDRIFWCTEEQFCSMSVVHMHDVLLSLQRIREAYDEAKRIHSLDTDQGITNTGAVAEIYFDVLCNAISLLAVATVESEAKEAVYHRQVLEILQSIQEQGVAVEAQVDKDWFERKRMMEYVFRRK